MHSMHSWMSPSAEIRNSEIHGKGVFATAPISKNERVAIFGGDIMFIEEIDRLPEDLQDYPMQIEERFVLGSRTAKAPEETDFFNHSCDPNLGIRGQIFLVAMRDIQVGEELCFDYAMAVSVSVGSDIVFEMDCQCGTRFCRKKITETDWLLPDLQKRYDGFFSQYLQEIINSANAPSI